MAISSHINTGISGYLSRSLSTYHQQAGIVLKESTQPTENQKNGDTAKISPKGRDLSMSHSSAAKEPSSVHMYEKTNDTANLDGQEIKQLMQLKQRDAEVRAHEQAHLAAAGPYARGGPSFTYQQGPDGVRYAVGGEVNIDLSKENTPEATIAKMQTIKRAAYAPASPSGADRSVAATASRIENQARLETLMQNQVEKPQAETAENTATAQKELSHNEQKSTDKGPSPSFSKFQAVAAAYQRAANGF